MPLYGSEERRMRVPGVGTDYTPQLVNLIDRATDRTRSDIAGMYGSAAQNTRDRYGIMGKMTAIPLEGLRGLSDAAEWRQQQRGRKASEEGQKLANKRNQLKFEEEQQEADFMNASEEEAQKTPEKPLAPTGQLPAWQPPGATGVDFAPWRQPAAAAPSLALPAIDPSLPRGVQQSMRDSAQVRAVAQRQAGQAPSAAMPPTAAPSYVPPPGASRRRALMGAQYGNMMAEEGMGKFRRGREYTVAGQHDIQADIAARTGEQNIKLIQAQIGQAQAGAGMTRMDRVEGQAEKDLLPLYEDPVKNAPAINAIKAGLAKAGFPEHRIQAIEGRAMIALRDKKAAAGQTAYTILPGGPEAQATIQGSKSRVTALKEAARNLAVYKSKVGMGETAPIPMHPEAKAARDQYKAVMTGFRPDAAQVDDTSVSMYGLFRPSQKMEAQINDEIAQQELVIQQLKSHPLMTQSAQFAAHVGDLERDVQFARQMIGGGGAQTPAGAGPNHNGLNLLTPQGAGQGGNRNSGLFDKKPPPEAAPPAASPLPIDPAKAQQFKGGFFGTPEPPQQGAPRAALGMPSFRHLAQRKPVDAREMQPI